MIPSSLKKVANFIFKRNNKTKIEDPRRAFHKEEQRCLGYKIEALSKTVADIQVQLKALKGTNLT